MVQKREELELALERLTVVEFILDKIESEKRWRYGELVTDEETGETVYDESGNPQYTYDKAKNPEYWGYSQFKVFEELEAQIKELLLQ